MADDIKAGPPNPKKPNVYRSSKDNDSRDMSTAELVIMIVGFTLLISCFIVVECGKKSSGRSGDYNDDGGYDGGYSAGGYSGGGSCGGDSGGSGGGGSFW